jgi:hypothetical protein
VRTLPTCPDLCQNPHNEAPGDAIHHYWPAIDIPQADGGRPLTVYLGFYEHDMRMRLEIGGFSLDLTGARILLNELGLKVAHAEELQLDLDVNRLLDRYQVA